MQDKKTIIFLCHFSNADVRNQLDLKEYTFRNALYKLQNKETLHYNDFAIWVSDYIKEFEKHNEYEFHIVSPHKGMKRNRQDFQQNGIYYHFFKCDSNYICDWLNHRFHLEEKNNYQKNRGLIKKIADGIRPDLVILCGAENPYYSVGVLDVQDKPIYVILQTLLNDPKRIEMKVGTAYRRKVEKTIFRHSRYFSVTGEKPIAKIKEFNSNAVILPSVFPTHRPIIEKSETKEFDFVFFARNVSKNKGIEDVLKAMSIVVKSHTDMSLNIIGDCNPDYKEQLEDLIVVGGIDKNVHFAGFYQQVEEMYNHAVKAKTAVLPGITAALNSTIREAMFMGLPTVCYRTSATDIINKDKTCLLAAPMGNVEELARLMCMSIEKPDMALEVERNGKEYAEREFSNRAIVDKLLENCRLIIEEKV
jgi:glycosyltransferase involved in cell wall biosynthesis